MLNVQQVLFDPAFHQVINCKHETGSFQNEGKYVRGNLTDFTVNGNLQPASQQDVLQFFPNGEINNRYVKVHSVEPVVMGEGDGVESDYVQFDGGWYRVIASKLYQQYGYWFSIAELTDL
jgi:hypothetical protein